MRIRRSVLLGAAFGGLLVVIAICAFAVWRSATVAQVRVAELHAASGRAAAAVSTLRTDIYLTAILTRDYLLDSDRSKVPQYIRQFSGIRKELRDSFAVLQAAAQDETQRRAIDTLTHEVEAYVRPTEIALGWAKEEKARYGSELLRQRVHRREEIFELVRQTEAVIAANFDRARQRITGADQEFRRSFAWTTSVALAVGLAIAVFTMLRMIRLERQSAIAELKLRELTAQLRMAQETERKKLSRELHDEVGQMLTGIRMELAALGRLNWSSDADVAVRISRAKSSVEQTLKLVRNIAMLIRPSMLDDLGLSPAIAWHTREFSRATGVSVHTAVDAEVDGLPEPHRTCVYRVVQEALTNCARHAAATNITVSITTSGSSLLLTIGDDGKGFAPGSARLGGLGLLGMEERVRELGGCFTIKSAPGTGTTVEVELPAIKTGAACA